SNINSQIISNIPEAAEFADEDREEKEKEEINKINKYIPEEYLEQNELEN
uniref:Uncharacterized protein n=1 Tax=Meloidogyne javanica TaxID=6303 RepID=A0A915MJN2_MELJA